MFVDPWNMRSPLLEAIGHYKDTEEWIRNMNKENNPSENDDKKIDNQEEAYCLVRTTNGEVFGGIVKLLPNFLSNEYTLLTLKNAILIEYLSIGELVRISQDDGKLHSFVLASRIPQISVMPDLIIVCNHEAMKKFMK